MTLPKNLPRGTQLVSYRVISADGHPVGGSMVFSIGAATAAAAAPGQAASVAGLIWLSRIGVYLGLFAGVGGAFFAGWIAPAQPGSKVVVAALVIGLIGAAASLGLQGLDALDLPLGGILDPASWQAACCHQPRVVAAESAVAAMIAALVAQQSASGSLARTLSALALPASGCRWPRADTPPRRRRNG